MEIFEYLKLVAVVKGSNFQEHYGEVYRSKFDDSYITMVGMESRVKFLADLEITEELSDGVGFSPKNNKWYGWSHMAIRGFSVGSFCSKCDPHYMTSNVDEAIETAIGFWKSPNRTNLKSSKPVNDEIIISWDIIDTSLGQITSVHHYLELGRGEWVAETMEDARQMAIDFKNCVDSNFSRVHF